MTKSVKILVLRNEIESILLSDILTERGIPHLVRSYHDSAYNGLWQAQAGWGHLEAPENFREEIFTIYSDLQKSSPEE
ncbi:MAG: hypothetical protein MUE32_09115 [Bacteroidales bacterium]|jgi:hypothetical protein|nr:hypothetical protein [Bacteroidales bacterium]